MRHKNQGHRHAVGYTEIAHGKTKSEAADVLAIEDSALHEVLHNGVRGVVHHHHLVALPANAAAHMEQGFRNELQGRRHFIREVSGWVEMPSV